MANTTNTNQQNGKASNGLDFDKAVSTVSEMGANIKDASQETIKKSVQVAKDYPIHTAIGAGVVGAAIGFLFGRLNNK